jgi:hypothetical protein
VVSPLALPLQNRFLVPSLGYDVVPFLRGQLTLVFLNACMLKVVPNSPHPFGLGGSKYLSKDFHSKESILFAASWGKVHTSLPYVNTLPISVLSSVARTLQLLPKLLISGKIEK